MQVRFKLEKETKGALRYQEIDKNGEAIEAPGGQDRSALHSQKRLPARERVAEGATRDYRDSRSTVTSHHHRGRRGGSGSK
jgi:hypothetical protein